MSRWWRAEDTSIDHPKLLMLSDSMHRAWYTLMCVASANDGELPPVEHIAARLRMKPGQVAAWITHLVTAGLFDNDAGTFRPHNWNKRQYKTDVTDPTNATRQKRYREKHRNTVTSGTDKRPETEAETEAETEQKQKPEANASGADARTRLFRDGLLDLAEITGKGPDACRSFVGKCLKAAGDDAMVVLGLIEDAKRNRVVDASAWIAARLKPAGIPSAKPLTDFQRKQQETNDVRAQLRAFANGGGGGGETDRYLSGDPGERPEAVRGGTGSTVLALPGASGRGGG